MKQLFSTFNKDLYPGLLAACILTTSILLVYSCGRSALLLASLSVSRSQYGTADLMMFFCFSSATKEIQDPVETAEKVGLAALIIQVSLSCLTRCLHCL